PSFLTIGNGGITNNSSSAQNIDAPLTIGAAQSWLSGPTSAGQLFINGDINTSSFLISCSGFADLNLSGIISGTGGFNFNGIQTVIMSGNANTYTGPTTLNTGNLLLNKNFNAINGPLIIGDGNGIDTVRELGGSQIADTSPVT